MESQNRKEENRTTPDIGACIVYGLIIGTILGTIMGRLVSGMLLGISGGILIGSLASIKDNNVP